MNNLNTNQAKTKKDKFQSRGQLSLYTHTNTHTHMNVMSERVTILENIYQGKRMQEEKKRPDLVNFSIFSTPYHLLTSNQSLFFYVIISVSFFQYSIEESKMQVGLALLISTFSHLPVVYPQKINWKQCEGKEKKQLSI